MNIIVVAEIVALLANKYFVNVQIFVIKIAFVEKKIENVIQVKHFFLLFIFIL